MGDETSPDAARARLAAEIEALRVALESETPPPSDEVRRRIDAIADAFLRLSGSATAG